MATKTKGNGKSKLYNNLTASNEGIVESRAIGLEEDINIEVTDLINTLTKERRAYVREMDTLSDLSPENSISLKPGGPNFNAKEWVKKLYELENKITIVDVKLKSANKIKDVWL